MNIYPDCDMNRWESQCSSYIQNADNYYTKKEVDDLIESATTSGSCCITPEEVDEKIESAKTEIEAEIPSLSGYATEQWVENQGYIKTVEPLKTINGETLVGEGNIVITGSSVTVDDHLDSASTNPVQNKVIVGALNDKLDASAYTPTDLSNYYTTAQTDSKISEAVSGKQDTLTAGRGISIANDTISVSLPVSAGTGDYSIAEGWNTVASGYRSHAEGLSTSATSYQSHAEGNHTLASGLYSHAEGSFTAANNEAEHASGKYNVSGNDTLFSVGNGTADNARHNAFEIKQNGDIYITSGSTDIKLQDHLGSGTATTYTAGDNITISNQNVISTITKFWCGTQAQYDQITTKDPNTVYMIHS